MNKGGPTVFRRMGLVQRGHFPNRWALNPVQKIEISARGIEFSDRKGSHVIDWLDVDCVRVVYRKIQKSYGFGGTEYLAKTMVIYTSTRKFSFDISSNFPDFENNDKLVKEISSRREIEIMYVNNRPWLKDIALGSILVGALYLIAKQFE